MKRLIMSASLPHRWALDAASQASPCFTSEPVGLQIFDFRKRRAHFCGDSGPFAKTECLLLAARQQDTHELFPQQWLLLSFSASGRRYRTAQSGGWLEITPATQPARSVVLLILITSTSAQAAATANYCGPLERLKPGRLFVFSSAPPALPLQEAPQWRLRQDTQAAAVGRLQ